jgi:hypothetical protein
MNLPRQVDADAFAKWFDERLAAARRELAFRKQIATRAEAIEETRRAVEAFKEVIRVLNGGMSPESDALLNERLAVPTHEVAQIVEMPLMRVQLALEQTLAEFEQARPRRGRRSSRVEDQLLADVVARLVQEGVAPKAAKICASELLADSGIDAPVNIARSISRIQK